MSSLALPSFHEIEALHREYTPSDAAFELVFTHCQVVSDIAMHLAEKSGVHVDTELVNVGCLLHDIGVYEVFAPDGVTIDTSRSIRHGVLGADILRRCGFPEQLCRFASHHTGAGLTKRQIVERRLPLPPQDFLAETLAEKLVMYADKFHSKSTPPVFNSHDFYTRYLASFGEEEAQNFVVLTAMFGKPDLDVFTSKYGQGLRT
ncbi:phosphohydrolase [Candidatus Saccharibacteria bacterium]|nr:MAG: phosphohydrolase [Candidatus Saccharibacteria bacterium]PID99363.1 MAG: phosphohydrolase [Candidatus Saccharibacteria bacterium]